MTSTTDIVVRFTSHSSKFQKHLDQVNAKMQKLAETQARVRVNANRFTKELTQGLNKASTEVVRFNGNMLSLLFFGMQLQRTFNSALKSIFEGYKKIIPESSDFNRMTTRLSANWEFFKFQLADAFAQSDLFKTFVRIAISLLQVFQKIPEPLKELIVWFLIIGSIIGGILFMVGTWALGIAGLINVTAAFGGAWTVVSGTIGLVTKGIQGVITLTTLLATTWAGFALIFVAVALLWKKFVDTFAKDLGFIIDDWTDYVKIFIGAFINGISQILIAMLRMPAFFIDVFTNIIRAAQDFGDLIKDIIASAFDPRKSVEDAWKDFFNTQVARFQQLGNTGTLGLLNNVSESISAKTLDLTRNAVNGSTNQTVINNNFYTLEEGLALGLIDNDTYNQAKGINTGI